MAKKYTKEAWMEAALSGSPAERKGARADALARKDELINLAGVDGVLFFASLMDQKEDALSLCDLLDGESFDEEIVELWDENPRVRLYGTALALRRGWELEGVLRDFLLAEVESYSPDNTETLEVLRGALSMLATASPGEALTAGGLCSECVARVLPGLEDEDIRNVLHLYGASLFEEIDRGGFLPPAEAHAILVLDLLQSDVAHVFLEGFCKASGDSLAQAAARLARVCTEIYLAVRQSEVQESVDVSPEMVRADPEILRGLFDSLQLPYTDVTGDTWEVSLKHKDEFGQKQRATMFVGLTARRLILRVPHPYGAISSDRYREMMERNHHSGLARFSCDAQGRVFLVSEMARDGFSPFSFEQALHDIVRGIESLLD